MLTSSGSTGGGRGAAKTIISPNTSFLGCYFILWVIANYAEVHVIHSASPGDIIWKLQSKSVSWVTKKKHWNSPLPRVYTRTEDTITFRKEHGRLCRPQKIHVCAVTGWIMWQDNTANHNRGLITSALMPQRLSSRARLMTPPSPRGLPHISTPHTPVIMHPPLIKHLQVRLTHDHEICNSAPASYKANKFCRDNNSGRWLWHIARWRQAWCARWKKWCELPCARAIAWEELISGGMSTGEGYE